VGDRDAAEALRGYVLEVPGSELPDLGDDEFYPFDLIGLEVRDESGVRWGRVTDAVETPAHALLVVLSDAGSAPEDALTVREVLVPFVTELCRCVCGRGPSDHCQALLRAGAVTKRIDIFTLVPQAFAWFLEQHPVSTATAAGVVTICVHNLREYGLMPHRGGGRHPLWWGSGHGHACRRGGGGP
jgi:hypothetical protein